MTEYSSTPEVVLDSQTVLDWLYFADPVCVDWENHRQAGRWCAVASLAMRAELAHVLGRLHLPGCTPQRAAQVLALFDARVCQVPEPAELGLARPMCRDRDDQKFIDLALVRRVRWLVSRDKAVLKLRSRVLRAAGVEVLTPAAWAAQLAPGANLCGHTHGDVVIGHAAHDDGVCADQNVVANGDGAQHFGAGANVHVVADHGGNGFFHPA